MNGDTQNNPQSPKKKSGPSLFSLLMAGFLITFLLNAFLSFGLTGNNLQIEYSDFIALVEGGYVEKVEIGDAQLSIALKDDASTAEVAEILEIENTDALRSETVLYTGLVDNPGLVQTLTDSGVSYYRPVTNSNPVLSFITSWILPVLLMYGVFMLLGRALSKRVNNSIGSIGGMMNPGKSKAKLYTAEANTGVTFADVAGQDEAKESLTEIVDYLHNPEKYRKIGAKQPKGALLVGPPGTGKTLLAKAIAGEARVPFFSLSGSEFIEMYVGVGASRVRDLFEQANKSAPCIIFIDEIDAIGKSRDNQLGSNDEREQTLNQLLAEMDGFDGAKGIVVLAATNRPEILDKALLRPGRFDRQIIVEKPDLIGRESILKVHSAKVNLSEDVDMHEIALATSGATGADLANMVNEAALRAVRMNREIILQEDLMESVELVIAGKEKKDRILNTKEKRMVAYHEVGHALASALQKNSQPVQKITIVPRTMGALGYTMQMPEEERYLLTESELRAQIVTLLAGRTAEEIVFGEATTGASNDIERASKLARSMVTQYGMSEKFDMMGLESTQSKYLDGRNTLTCSEATGAEIDKEVADIIRSCHQEARTLLESELGKLHEISEFLIEKETISGKEFMALLNAE